MIPTLQLGQMGRRILAGASDPYWANVVSLLHFDGADGSTTITDQTGKVWTANGNAQIDTAQSKFGGASGLFDGSGDYLTVPASTDWALPGDFTIELWIRPTSGGGAAEQHIVQNRDGTNNGFVLIRNIATGILTFGSDTGGLSGLTSSTAAAANAWTQVEVNRSGSSMRLFVNGVQEGSATSSQNFNSQNMVIGRRYAFDGAFFREYAGHIDEFRLTKGVARHTANFTPSTIAFSPP